jgi:hypothetical protein
MLRLFEIHGFAHSSGVESGCLGLDGSTDGQLISTDSFQPVRYTIAQ